MTDADVLRIYEKLGAMEQVGSSAHKRIDSFVTEMRASTNEIKLMIEKLMDKKDREIDALEAQFQEMTMTVNTKIDELTGTINRGKGWAAAGLFIAGVAGAGAMEMVQRLFNK